MLIKVSCETIFNQNPVSFDGSNLIRKFGEIQAIYLALAESQNNQELFQKVNQSLIQGLWQLQPGLDQQTAQNIIGNIVSLLRDFTCSKVKGTAFQAGYITLVKQILQSVKNTNK